MKLEDLFVYAYKLGYEDRAKERSYDPHSHAIPEVDYEPKLYDINDKQPDIGSLVVGYHSEYGMLLGEVVSINIDEDEPMSSCFTLRDSTDDMYYPNMWQPVFEVKE